VKVLIPKTQVLSGIIEALGQVEIRQSTLKNIKRVAAQELKVYKGDTVPRKVLEQWYKQNSREYSGNRRRTNRNWRYSKPIEFPPT
jgi:hypothetical protein